MEPVAPTFAPRGSQRWLQIAVSRAPGLLDESLREAGVIGPSESVRWASPLAEQGFRELRDDEALRALALESLPVRALTNYWPQRGPVWDALGISSDNHRILLEAKAHIAEAASPPSKARPESLERIEAALAEARAWYAPRATAIWSKALYQYANRLAFHYFLAKANGISSRLVFLDFFNDEEMRGPDSPDKWKGATEMMHALLGLPKDLTAKGVFHVYLDVRRLRELV